MDNLSRYSLLAGTSYIKEKKKALKKAVNLAGSDRFKSIHITWEIIIGDDFFFPLETNYLEEMFKICESLR